MNLGVDTASSVATTSAGAVEVAPSCVAGLADLSLTSDEFSKCTLGDVVFLGAKVLLRLILTLHESDR